MKRLPALRPFTQVMYEDSAKSRRNREIGESEKPVLGFRVGMKIASNRESMRFITLRNRCFWEG
jgi:hypothetical protein